MTSLSGKIMHFNCESKEFEKADNELQLINIWKLNEKGEFIISI